MIINKTMTLRHTFMVSLKPPKWLESIDLKFYKRLAIYLIQSHTIIIIIYRKLMNAKDS